MPVEDGEQRGEEDDDVAQELDAGVEPPGRREVRHHRLAVGVYLAPHVPGEGLHHPEGLDGGHAVDGLPEPAVDWRPRDGLQPPQLARGRHVEHLVIGG